MADKRNISILIPKLLLDQIQKRSKLNDRSRNQEFRYLLARGLALAGVVDVTINLPEEDMVKSVTRIDHETYAILHDRTAKFKRSLSGELIHLVAYAIQDSTNENVRIIEEMIRRQGLPARGAPPLEPPEPQPC